MSRHDDGFSRPRTATKVDEIAPGGMSRDDDGFSRPGTTEEGMGDFSGEADVTKSCVLA